MNIENLASKSPAIVIGPDDVVVVTIDRYLTGQQLAEIGKSFKRKLPGRNVLVIQQGMRIEAHKGVRAPAPMMMPIETEHTNKVLGAPADWDPKLGSCIGLPVHHDQAQSTWFSFYKPTPGDLIALASGMPIRLSVIGQGHPPVAIAVRDDIAP